LVALDSFALGKPIVATHENNHGPEIAYLEDGVDCVMTERSVEAYAGAVVELLTQHERLGDMQRRCLLKASTYSIETMVDNMRRGVLAALGA
jgi:glycosyltransferase involved in cell wall biosynthesis